MMIAEMPLAPKIHLIVLSILAWFALLAQLSINLQIGTETSTETIIRFFSFFTILTNLIVAVCCTSLVVSNKSRLALFFAKNSVFTAIVIYILVVGIIYNVVLRQLWQPTGLQCLVDELLHVVNPIYFTIIWIIYVPKTFLKLRQSLKWLIYPITYLIYILIRGAISGFYPYPFVDVAKFGINQVLVNTVAIFSLFFLLGTIFIAISNYLLKKQQAILW